MKQEVLIGQADYTVLILIRDTAGAPKTGLTEASVDIAYARVETDNDVTTSDVTPAALSALTDAHTDWGFEEVSATDHPGLYRLDIADAVFASGAWSAVVTVVGTGLDPTSIEFVMVPNSPLTGVLLAPTTHTSAVIPTVTTTGTATAVTTVNGLAAGVITAAAIATGAIDADALAADASTEINAAVLAVLGALNDAAADGAVTTTDTLVAYLKQIINTLEGTPGIPTWPASAAPGNAVSIAEAIRQIYDNLVVVDDLIDTEVGAIKTVTDAIGATGTGLSAIPWNAAWDAEVESEATDALNAYDPPTRTEATSDKDAILAKLPAALVSGRIDASVGAMAANVITDDAFDTAQGLLITRSAIGSTGNDTTHLHLNIDGERADDDLNSYLLVINDVTGNRYARWIEDYVGATSLATVATLPFTPSGGNDIYQLYAIRADVTGGSGLDAAGVRAAVGLASANLDTQLTAIDDYLDTEVGALTTELAKVPKSDSNVSWNATALAAIQSEANDALVANKLDHLVAVADADDPVDNSIVAKLASKSATADWSSYVNTTDSLEANRDNIGTAGAGLTAADDAVVTLLGTPAGASVSADILTLDNLVDDLESRLGTPSDLGSGATVAANLADIEGQTDDIGAAGAGLTALATAAELAKVPKSDSNVTWNATAAAQIQTEANDAIVANRLDELLAADSDIDGAAPPTVGSVFHELMSKTAGSFTFDQTTDSNEAIRDKLTDIETDTGEIGAAGAGLTALATQASVNTIDDFLDTEVAAIKAKTDQLTFTTANQVDAQTVSMAANVLTAAATHSDFGTEVATAVWASATRTLSALGFTLGASDLAADTIGASELAADAITEIVNAVLTTAMTESYNADGAAPTLAQAIFVTMQRLTEFAISGTTITVKKLDGSTTAYTLTLDDATSPTSSTRAS